MREPSGAPPGAGGYADLAMPAGPPPGAAEAVRPARGGEVGG
jgi:hypothetical protein